MSESDQHEMVNLVEEGKATNLKSSSIEEKSNERCFLNISSRLLSLGLFLLFNVIFVIADIYSDIYAGINFVLAGDTNWGIITLTLTLLPFSARILVAFSYFCYCIIMKTFHKEESRKKGWNFLVDAFWQFPLCHPIKNFRSFFSLLLMKTELPINTFLVHQMKSEGLALGFYEGFLEATPQLLFQISIIIRYGVIGVPQLISIPLSMVSLTLASIKIFYYQRLGKYRETNANVKQLMVVFPFIFLQTLFFVLVWALLTAYFQGYVILCVFFVMMIDGMAIFGVLGKFSFTNLRRVVQFDAGIDGVAHTEKNQEPWRIIIIGVLISWISPFTVWSNNNLNQSIKAYLNKLNAAEQKDKKYVKSHATYVSRFLLLTLSFATILSICLLLIVLTLFLFYDKTYLIGKGNFPLTSCLSNNDTNLAGCYQTGQNQSNFCLYLCTSKDCPEIVSFCGVGEEPSGRVLLIFMPILLCFSIMTSILACCIQKLGNYNSMMKWSHYFFYRNSLIHFSLIHDLMSQKTLLEEANDEQLKLLIEKCELETLNYPDPVTGNTCLHIAFIKGLQSIVDLILEKGANANQKNVNGETVISISNMHQHMDYFKREKWPILTDTFSSLDGVEVMLYIMILQDKPVVQSTLFSSDSKLMFTKRVQLTETGNVICMFRELSEVIQKLSLLKTDFGINQTMFLINQIKETRQFNIQLPRQCETEDSKKQTGYCHNLLFSTLTRNKTLKLKVLVWLGGNLSARNENEEIPLLYKLKRRQIEQNNDDLIWFVVKHTDAKSLFICRDYFEKIIDLVKMNISSLPQNLDCIFIRAASTGDLELVKSFLSHGYGENRVSQQNMSPLHFASKEGKTEIVEHLCKIGWNVNQESFHGYPALTFALHSSNMECVKHIVTSGGNVDYSDQIKTTPLFYAFSRECAEFLIAKGANVNHQNKDLETPLHIAATNNRVDAAQVFIEKGALLELKDKLGWTPLETAVVNNNLDVACLLIEKGADVYCSGKEKVSLLLFAITFNHTEMMKVLIGKIADVEEHSKGVSPLVQAIWMNHYEAAELLIKSGALVNSQAEDGSTVLHDLILSNNPETQELHKKSREQWNLSFGLNEESQKGIPEIMELLIKSGANLNIPTNAGKTPLHHAMSNKNFEVGNILVQHGGHPNLNSAIEDQDLEMVTFLLNSGASVNIANENGEAPLHAAIAKRNLELVKILIGSTNHQTLPCNVDIVEHRADLNITNAFSETPLHYAVVLGDVETVELLVKNGAKLNIQREDGVTPLILSIIAENVDIFQFLLCHGASISIPDNRLNLPLHYSAKKNNEPILRLLLQIDNIDINVLNENNATPLHCAVVLGDVETVELLVKNGAKLNVQKEDGKTPLILSIIEKKIDIAEFLLCHGASISIPDNRLNLPLHYSTMKNNEPILRLLLQIDNIDINVLNENNATPLHLAVSDGNIDAISLLVEKGADVDSLTKSGNSALHCAAFKGSKPCISELIKFNANKNVVNSDGDTPYDVAYGSMFEDCFPLLKFQD